MAVRMGGRQALSKEVNHGVRSLRSCRMSRRPAGQARRKTRWNLTTEMAG